MGLESFDDDQIKAVVKSLSISYDAMTKKLERLNGRHRREAIDELVTIDRTLAEFKAEQTQRWRVQAS